MTVTIVARQKRELQRRQRGGGAHGHERDTRASQGGRADRRRVPSPPLAGSGPFDPIYYAFVRGRLRFVVSDLRSARGPTEQSDDEGKSMLGSAQLAWFGRQLTEARAAGQAILWVSSVPWISGPSKPQDRWGDFSTERRKLVDMIRDAGMLGSIAILSGDMHALAFDDGTHSAGAVPVMHAAPLDRGNSEKGGPYTVGPITASESQYGLIDITDEGSERLALRFRGIAVNQYTGLETIEIDERFTLAAGSARETEM